MAEEPTEAPISGLTPSTKRLRFSLEKSLSWASSPVVRLRQAVMVCLIQYAHPAVRHRSVRESAGWPMAGSNPSTEKPRLEAGSASPSLPGPFRCQTVGPYSIRRYICIRTSGYASGISSPGYGEAINAPQFAAGYLYINIVANPPGCPRHQSTPILPESCILGHNPWISRECS